MRSLHGFASPKRMLLLVMGLQIPALGGCVFDHDRRSADLEAMRRATGDMIEFRVTPGPGEPERWIRGEVLELHLGSVLVATFTQFLHVPLDRIAPADRGKVMDAHPRYPRHLPPDQLRRLMAQAGVERIDSIGQPALHPDSDHADHTLDSFLLETRQAAEPFRELEHAIAMGYRRLGPSFPGMGEHWIHPGRIVEGRVAADRPPVLCYARIDGRPRLVAVAFAVPLEPDEAPPAYPAGPHVWHDHSHGVDEETLLLSHPGSHHGTDGPRLAMFHAWLWVENVDGVLAQNNWRLPFLQAGLDTTALRPSADAGRALSLHTSGPPYYLELFRAAGARSAAEMETLERLLTLHAGSVQDMITGASADSARLDMPGLEAVWRALWVDIQASLPPDTYRAMAVLR